MISTGSQASKQDAVGLPYRGDGCIFSLKRPEKMESDKLIVTGQNHTVTFVREGGQMDRTKEGGCVFSYLELGVSSRYQPTHSNPGLSQAGRSPPRTYTRNSRDFLKASRGNKSAAQGPGHCRSEVSRAAYPCDMLFDSVCSGTRQAVVALAGREN
jgi:hypothetical protein